MGLLKESMLTRKRCKTISVEAFPKEYDIHTNAELGNHDLFITHSHSNDSSVLFVYGSYEIVFSGALSNKQSIKDGLVKEGFTFHTASNAEVLCALYAHKQERLLEDLRGKFSFIIWDKEENILFGARDHFGIQPLYYMKNGNGIYFASEIRAFEPFIHRAKINIEGLHHYFSFQYVPQPMTVYNDIYALEAGKYFYRRGVSS